MDFDKTAREYRKLIIDDFTGETACQVNYEQNDIIKIIPHRKPFLFVDSINAIDLKNESVMGKRRIDPGDPVFQGHFPGNPVYPGALQMEMVWQMGICLYYFLKMNSTQLPDVSQSIKIRAIRVNHAVFHQEIKPSDDLLIIAKKLYCDDLVFRGIGQLVRNNTVCAVLISEMYIMS